MVSRRGCGVWRTMHLVDRPSNPPHCCAVNPSVKDDPDGFVHTGVVLNYAGPAVYVSVSSVRKLADLIGCATPEQKAELEGRVAELERQVADLEQDLKAADYQINAIEVLRNGGFEAKKRAGRPPKGAKVA